MPQILDLRERAMNPKITGYGHTAAAPMNTPQPSTLFVWQNRLSGSKRRFNAASLCSTAAP